MAQAVAARRAEGGEIEGERLLARRPIVGIAMLLFGAILFGFFLWNYEANGPLIPWDHTFVSQVHAWAVHQSAFVKWVMLTGSWIGQSGVIYLGVALGLLWIVRRKWLYVAMLALGPGLCEGLYQVLGGLVNRHRPVFSDPIEVLKGPGFPSGHTSVGVAFFGLLAYLLWPHLTQTWQRVLTVAVPVLLLLYIGASRLFQGVHYPTDLLAGYALGIAWSGLVYTVLEAFAKRKQERQ